MTERKCILVSRFNWPHKRWDHIGNDTNEYRAWLDGRLGIFERFTVKSIRNCYVKPDIWLILISDTIIDCSKELSRILHGLPYRLVTYSGLSLSDSVKNALSDLTFPVELRMSRLDTDDLVASDFFARLGAVELTAQELEDGTVISFPGGSNYDTRVGKFYYSSYPNNPFLSYVEKVNSALELRTVFWKSHVDLCDPPTRTIFLRTFHPMWASVVHENNLMNASLLDTNKVELSDGGSIRRKMGIH